MNTRKFHISDVLSITDVHLVSTRHMEGVYDILNFMTGQDLMTHQLPRAVGVCEPFLSEKFPLLGPPTEELKGDQAAIDRYVAEQAKHYGEWLDVDDLPPGTYDVRNPLEELLRMRGGSHPNTDDHGIIMVEL